MSIRSWWGRIAGRGTVSIGTDRHGAYREVRGSIHLMDWGLRPALLVKIVTTGGEHLEGWIVWEKADYPEATEATLRVYDGWSADSPDNRVIQFHL